MGAQGSWAQDRVAVERLVRKLYTQGCKAMANPLRIGATIPNFDIKTTKGDFKFHEWLTGDSEKPWTVFFSHPKDYTPVCTTELGQCHCLSEKFAKLGAKLIGFVRWSRRPQRLERGCLGP